MNCMRFENAGGQGMKLPTFACLFRERLCGERVLQWSHGVGARAQQGGWDGNPQVTKTDIQHSELVAEHLILRLEMEVDTVVTTAFFAAHLFHGSPALIALWAIACTHWIKFCQAEAWGSAFPSAIQGRFLGHQGIENHRACLLCGGAWRGTLRAMGKDSGQSRLCVLPGVWILVLHHETQVSDIW